MRDYILLFINGKKHKISSLNAKQNLSEYLRDTKGMKGTKIVCSEGDCGACTVLVHRFIDKDKKTFSSINSCIAPLYVLDCCHIITIEGIESSNSIHPVQEAIAKHHGTQCGFCTPGIVNALVSMSDDLIAANKNVDIKKIKNYTTGNLCRCTGYKGIIKAGMSLNLSEIQPLFQRYNSKEIQDELEIAFKEEVVLNDIEKEISIVLPKTIKRTLELKTQEHSVISGGTDISVFVNKGYNKTKKFVSLTNIDELYEIENNDKYISFASRVNLTDVEKECEEYFEEFSNSLKVFASPQIKNKGTLIGNIANGSPIGDSIPFLYVSDASLELLGTNGAREVLIPDFYLGYKKFDLKANEIITKVKIPKKNKQFKIYKVSARKDLDISAVSLALGYKIENDKIIDISIAYGGVAATVYKAKALEEILLNKEVKKEYFEEAISLIPSLLTPFSDHRGSSEFRIKLCQNLLMKFYSEIASQREVA